LISHDQLKTLLHKPGLGRAEQVCLCLAVDHKTPKPVNTVKALAVSAGLGSARAWNLAKIFRQKPPLAIRVPLGWELSAGGIALVCKMGNIRQSGAQAQTVAATLRTRVASITNPDTKAFLEEAVQCLELQLFRAAVVLSWVGAMSLIYDKIIHSYLPQFNVEASKRDPKWKPAKTSDDLSRLKEQQFLDIIDHLSVIGKNVKQELQNCLTLRNSCGHPNSLKIGENRVTAHIEILILNIYSKF
jgi:hypothetical protein